jgi:DNA-binding transcriptional ArsR family regulator
MPLNSNQGEIYPALMKAFRNQTKLSIIFLLAGNKKMTVTQMSRDVKVTKANLYHFVKEMVSEGLLSEPEVRVTKNFVEKYYSLNEESFRMADPLEVERRLRRGNLQDLLAMVRSFLTSLGLQFHLLAEEFARADEAELKKIAVGFREQRILLHYSMLSDEAYGYELKEYDRIIKKSIARWGRKESPEPRNRLIMVGLPAFRQGQDARR